MTVIFSLVSCASKQIGTSDKPNIDNTTNKTEASSESFYSDSPTPQTTLEKGSKRLKLVRVMEGGACKNDKQGAQGVFLIYSDPDDIERIKRKKGSAIFSIFEKEIQEFSLVALDKAVKAIEITVDPFALDDADAQSKVFIRLAKSFRLFVEKDRANFQKKTSLTVEIIPFKRTFEFYINNCEVDHAH
jgi:hypothetical protein